MSAKDSWKKKKREDKKKKLMLMGDKVLKERGTLDFGAKESDLITLQNAVRQLAVSNNNIAAEIDAYRKFDLLEKSKHNNWMLSATLKMLADAGKAMGMITILLHEKKIISDSDFVAIDRFIPTEEKIHKVSRSYQEKDVGLEDKSSGTVEDKDVIVMNFKIYDQEDKVIHDEKADAAYHIGSKTLPEIVDSGMIGMRLGETRFFDGVVFEQGQIARGHEGKSMRMQVVCKGIKLWKENQNAQSIA